MPEIKTKKNAASAEDFLNSINKEDRRKDAFTILKLMQKATNSEPKMWGSAIVGFGESSYTTSNGEKNDWFVMGFAPRKKNFALYLTGEKSGNYASLIKKLGKHSTSQEGGNGCLYIDSIADVDTKVLKELFEWHVKGK